jgi:hypothetical protein
MEGGDENRTSALAARGFQIQDFRLETPDSRFQIQDQTRRPCGDFRIKISNLRFQIGDFRFKISDSRSSAPATRGFQNQDFKFEISDWRLQIQDFRFKIKRAGHAGISESRFQI